MPLKANGPTGATRSAYHTSLCHCQHIGSPANALYGFLEVTRQLNHVKRRRKKGLCSREGCKVETPRYRCDEHQEEHRLEQRARYWRKREEVLRAREEKAA